MTPPSHVSAFHDPPTPTASPAPPTALERWLLRRALEGLGEPPITLALWNGEVVWRPHGDSLGRVRLNDRHVLRDIAVHGPYLAFGDAYASGQLEVEGDLARVLAETFRAGYDAPAWARALTSLARLRPHLNTPRRSRRNVHHHYDIGNDFYRLWLDDAMVYTCAYFETPAATLEEAQRAKHDHVCRKLALRPGERVVEAGCGWGALALHMAEHYGVSVRAYNVSDEQIRWAREQASSRGLEDRVEFVLDDYREIRGSFDAFVSVGMLEHVGPSHYRTLGRLIERTLVPGGRGLLHFIGHAEPVRTNTWFERRIFPGSYMPALSEALAVLESSTFAPVDVENLRRHYARTLEYWLDRFEKSVDRIESMYDGRFVRMWRLYLCGALAAFRSGSCQLYQVVFSRRDDTALPWTRRYQYERREEPEARGEA